MQDSIFCPKCGTSNHNDFKFCTSCGFDLSTIGKVAPENTGTEKTPPPYTAPVQTKPAPVAAPAKAASAMPRWVAPVIIIVVLAGIGFLIWNNEQSKNKNPGLTQNDNGIKDGHDISIITDQAKIKLKDFAGVWRAYESSDPGEKLGDSKDDLFIEVSNGRVTMYARDELDEEDRKMDITCDELVGNAISCMMKSKGNPEGSTATMKLELQPSKNDMTVTITQSQSSEEKLIVKARRLGEGGN
jgi:hypothetical protein